jgi:hypothetical protein
MEEIFLRDSVSLGFVLAYLRTEVAATKPAMTTNSRTESIVRLDKQLFNTACTAKKDIGKRPP